MIALTAGQQAPTFTLPNQEGKPVNLADLRGKWVVIYFYPKAMTSGCTVQACNLRDGQQLLEKLNVAVLGLSPDAPKALQQFAQKEKLNFTLLSDSDHRVAEAYGTWQQKSMYGRTYMGMTRSTFLLDKDGIIRKIWPKVDPKTHLADIVEWLESNI